MNKQQFNVIRSFRTNLMVTFIKAKVQRFLMFKNTHTLYFKDGWVTARKGSVVLGYESSDDYTIACVLDHPTKGEREFEAFQWMEKVFQDLLVRQEQDARELERFKEDMLRDLAH